MKKIFLFLTLLVSLPAFAETLRFSKFKTTLETEWKADPSTSSETVMLVQLLDERNEPVELEARLGVEIFMPDMGHGSGPTALERVLDETGEIVPGAYLVKNMWFIMEGLWEVRVTLRKGQVSETKVFALTL